MVNTAYETVDNLAKPSGRLLRHLDVPTLISLSGAASVLAGIAVSLGGHEVFDAVTRMHDTAALIQPELVRNVTSNACEVLNDAGLAGIVAGPVYRAAKGVFHL